MANKKLKKTMTLPTYTYQDTSDENVKRFVDIDGNWTHYFLVKEHKFVKAVTHVTGLGYNKGPRFNEYLLSITKDEQQKVLTEAGDRGARVHKAVQDLIAGIRITMDTKYPSDVSGRQEALSMREWKALLAFIKFCEVYQPRVIAYEKTVYSAKHDFAGTFDAALIVTVPSADKYFPKAVWGKDVLFLPDWKTSAGIWDEYKAQIAAYMEGIIERGILSEFLDAYKGLVFTGVVRIGTKHASGYELRVWDEKTTRDHHFKHLFLGAQSIANEIQPDFEPDVEEVPMELFINMPQAKLASKKVKKARKASSKK